MVKLSEDAQVRITDVDGLRPARSDAEERKRRADLDAEIKRVREGVETRTGSSRSSD